jgi:hypothetical protein
MCDGHHVEPIEEVFPESVPRRGAHPLVLVGRGHDPHVHRNRLFASYPLQLPLLEDPEKANLGGGRSNRGDLVQEEGTPVVGQFETAPAAASPPR